MNLSLRKDRELTTRSGSMCTTSCLRRFSRTPMANTTLLAKTLKTSIWNSRATQRNRSRQWISPSASNLQVSYPFLLLCRDHKLITGVAKLLQQSRQASGSVGRAGSVASRQTLDRKSSTSTYGSKADPVAPPNRTLAAPPPYTSSQSSTSISKGAAPPPLKPKPSFGAAAAPAPKYATATFDFEAQAEGDLSFHAGDRIEIVEQSENADDWWTGRLDGRQGIFPGTYTQTD